MLSTRNPVLWALAVALPLLLASATGASFGLAQEGQGNQGATAQFADSPGRTVVYAYDAAGRLVSANYGGGVGLAYSYDAVGNLVGLSPGGGHNVYLPLVVRGLAP